MKKITLITFIILMSISLASFCAFAKEADPKEEAKAKIKGETAELDAKVAKLQRNVKTLQNNLDQEITERDILMLQKRFVAGKEFYFMLEDYRNSAEIFWGIVLHPAAKNFTKYHEAVYYLAESLFNMGYYYDSQTQYERLVLLGSNGEYFAFSLMRLIEISIAQKNYAAAEKYYARLIAELPPDADGSLGTYLIGKSYYLRGESEKAFEILEGIPTSADHYAVAQYYMAALEVKGGKFDDANTRLRKLSAALRTDKIAHKENITALTRLSLGRLSYESNDFPQALSQYWAVPSESTYYPEALYESIWVLSTRNDFLLKAVANEDVAFSKLVNDFAFMDHGLAKEDDRDAVTGVASVMDELEPNISQMSQMLEKIDERLSNLQQEAIETYNKLVIAAPGSPDLPEAEMLIGGIYTQVEDYKAAEAWYRKTLTKYSNFANNVHNAHSRFRNDRIAVEAVTAGNTPVNEPMPDTMRLGLPPEITYWLAADKEVRRVFTIYSDLLIERQNLQYMRGLVRDIESELRSLESGTGFPILKQTYQRILSLRNEAGSIDAKIALLNSQLSVFDKVEKDDDKESGDKENEADKEAAKEKAAIAAKLDEYDKSISDIKITLNALERRIERRKREKIASYRQEFITLSAPITQYASDVERMFANASDLTANAARRGLTQIEQRLVNITVEARIGIVDTGWRATEGSSRDVKLMQRRMQDDIRRFRRNMRGANESGNNTDGSSDNSSDDEAK